MYEDIFPNEVNLWRNKGARLVDVREPWEFAQVRIPGTENIPLGQLAERLAELEGPIVCICAAGGRSAMAAEFLAGLGKKLVANLMGGTHGWMSAGFGVER